MKNAEAKCWMCGAPADSGEHRIKQTDLKTLYGLNSNTPFFNSSNMAIPLQSYNSKLIKSNVLCKRCNGTISQPYDRAYEKFIKYITDNKKEIIYKRFIDFSMIYGDDWGSQQVNLYKYFAKSFGTRLASVGMPVPRDVVALFDKKVFKTALIITFAVNENILKIHKDKNTTGGIGNGNLLVNQTYLDGVDPPFPPNYTYEITSTPKAS